MFQSAKLVQGERRAKRKKTFLRICFPSRSLIFKADIFCKPVMFFSKPVIFFTICAEKVCYKLANIYYKICNTRYKVSNKRYKVCNKNSLI